MAKQTFDRSKITDCKDLEELITNINKKCGDGSLQLFDHRKVVKIDAISTGALSLDIALGVMGVPRGRIIEIFGPESSGKTTLALSIIANTQRNGGVAAFIDAEHALDITWAGNIGVDVQKLLVSQPDSGEQAIEICEMLALSNRVSTIIIDSVAALIPQAELDGEITDTNIGAQARLLSKAMRKLCGVVKSSNVCVVFINQIRDKIGGMSYGSNEVTPGGRALKFYASVRLDIRKIGIIKDSSNIPIGTEVKVKVAKNKVSPPFGEGKFNIYFGKGSKPTYGISMASSVLIMAIEAGIIKKRGSWYIYGDLRLGLGEEAARVFLQENQDVLNEMTKKVIEAIPQPNIQIEEDDEDPELANEQPEV